MMIREMEARTLLVTCKKPSAWFGVRYNMNLYRGCEHRCIYCDSRSECYGIENFHDLTVKKNAVELLRKELAAKRKKGTVGTGAMGDPYTPSERKLGITRKALEVLAEFRYPVHITTKSNLVLRDVDLLEHINRIYASVAITLTTADDELARKIEPCAPSPTDRLKALGVLSAVGINTSVTMMPILPFLEDNEANITGIVRKAGEQGVKNIVPWIGMSLRDRQRAYYYGELDKLFPGTRQRYEKRYGTSYHCPGNNAKRLYEVFNEACHKYGISSKMPSYESKMGAVQLSLLDG